MQNALLKLFRQRSSGDKGDGGRDGDKGGGGKTYFSPVDSTFILIILILISGFIFISIQNTTPAIIKRPMHRKKDIEFLVNQKTSKDPPDTFHFVYFKSEYPNMSCDKFSSCLQLLSTIPEITDYLERGSPPSKDNLFSSFLIALKNVYAAKASHLYNLVKTGKALKKLYSLYPMLAKDPHALKFSFFLNSLTNEIPSLKSLFLVSNEKLESSNKRLLFCPIKKDEILYSINIPKRSQLDIDRHAMKDQKDLFENLSFCRYQYDISAKSAKTALEIYMYNKRNLPNIENLIFFDEKITIDILECISNLSLYCLADNQKPPFISKFSYEISLLQVPPLEKKTESDYKATFTSEIHHPRSILSKVAPLKKSSSSKHVVDGVESRVVNFVFPDKSSIDFDVEGEEDVKFCAKKSSSAPLLSDFVATVTADTITSLIRRSSSDYGFFVGFEEENQQNRQLSEKIISPVVDIWIESVGDCLERFLRPYYNIYSQKVFKNILAKSKYYYLRLDYPLTSISLKSEENFTNFTKNSIIDKGHQLEYFVNLIGIVIELTNFSYLTITLLSQDNWNVYWGFEKCQEELNWEGVKTLLNKLLTLHANPIIETLLYRDFSYE